MASGFGSTSGFGSAPPGSDLFGSSPAFGFPSAFGPQSAFGARSPQVSAEETHSKSFMRNLAGLFNDAKYSDATIRIHNVTLPVHKSVICIQSDYFEKAFQENFVEGISGLLPFEEGSGAAHWRVFEYLYTGNYSEVLSTNHFEDDPLLLKDLRVYALADMFFLEDLKALSQRRLGEKLKSCWKNDSFSDCVREVYASTPNSGSKIRSVVVEIAAGHARELNKKESFKELLQEGGDFAVEYVEFLTKKLSMR